MGLQVREIKAKEGNSVDYKVQGLIFLKNIINLLLRLVNHFSPSRSHEYDAMVGFVCLCPRKKKKFAPLKAGRGGENALALGG